MQSMYVQRKSDGLITLPTMLSSYADMLHPMFALVMISSRTCLGHRLAPCIQQGHLMFHREVRPAGKG